MNTLGLSNPSSFELTSLPAPVSRQRETQDAFASVLGRQAARKSAQASPEMQAREAAEQLVAIAFVQPVLAQLRSTRSAEPPFGVTQAERQFGSMLDGMRAHSMVKAGRWPLVDRLARDLLKNAGNPAGPDAVASKDTSPQIGKDHS